MAPTPTIAVTIGDLKSIVARYCGYPRGTVVAELVADIEEIVARGLRRFYSPELTGKDQDFHRWTFLTPSIDLAFNALRTWTHGVGGVTFSYNATTSTLTIAGSTWPTWAAYGLIRFGGRQMRVVTRTSSTIIVLAPVPDVLGAVTFATNDDVTIYHIRLLLDTTVAGFCGSRFRVDGRSIDAWATVASAFAIEQMMGSTATLRSDGWIERIAIQPTSTTVGTETQKSEVLVWPPPVSNQMVRARVHIAPDTGLSSDSNVPLGGAMHAETIVCAVLATCEEYFGARKSQHRIAYQSRLYASIELDRMNRGSVLLGYNGDGRDEQPFVRDGPLLVNGVEPL